MTAENEPGMFIKLEGEEFESTPDNTSLFRFIGNLAIYNHVYICLDAEEGKGTYVFNQNPAYETFEEYMVANDYPIHDNLRDISDCDLDAFEEMVKIYTDKIPDSVPEEWLKA